MATHRASRRPLAGWARDELRNRRARPAGGQSIYDVWDPTLGTDTAAHMVLPNTTGNGHLLQRAIRHLGERGSAPRRRRPTINGIRNFSNQQTEISVPDEYDYGSSTDAVCAVVSFRLSLPNGDKLVLGGREDWAPESRPQLLKSIDRVRGGKRCGAPQAMRLSGPTGKTGPYPRAFVAPDGRVSCWATAAPRSIWTRPGTARITQSAQTHVAGNRTPVADVRSRQDFFGTRPAEGHPCRNERRATGDYLSKTSISCAFGRMRRSWPTARSW